MGEARGRKRLDGSDVDVDVDDDERTSVLSDLTSDSNDSRDDLHGDVGASSSIRGPR
jgi:hypothetical protein